MFVGGCGVAVDKATQSSLFGLMPKQLIHDSCSSRYLWFMLPYSCLPSQWYLFLSYYPGEFSSAHCREGASKAEHRNALSAVPKLIDTLFQDQRPKLGGSLQSKCLKGREW